MKHEIATDTGPTPAHRMARLECRDLPDVLARRGPCRCARGVRLRDLGIIARPGGPVGRAALLAKIAQALDECRETATVYEVCPVALTSPELVAARFAPYLPAGLRVERFAIQPVDVKLHPVGEPILLDGASDHARVNLRAIVKVAFDRDASGFFLAHNHPAGDPTPSPEDRRATRKVAEVCEQLGLRCFDHVVTGAGRWFSIAQGFEVTP